MTIAHEAPVDEEDLEAIRALLKSASYACANGREQHGLALAQEAFANAAIAVGARHANTLIILLFIQMSTETQNKILALWSKLDTWTI